MKRIIPLISAMAGLLLAGATFAVESQKDTNPIKPNILSHCGKIVTLDQMDLEQLNIATKYGKFAKFAFKVICPGPGVVHLEFVTVAKTKSEQPPPSIVLKQYRGKWQTVD